MKAHEMERWLLFVAGSIVLLSWSGPVWSQENTEAEPPSVAQETPTASTDTKSAEAPTLESLQQRIEEIENKQANQERTALENASEAAISFKPSLSVFGFMTLSLTRAWVKRNNAINNIMHEELSFAFSNVNLLFQSSMTQSLSALVELYFTFAPNGNESFNPYQRVDTTVTESSTLRQHVLGGVAIERAQATWQRFDFFGVTVGRFITPYGVWNVEHSPTVFLPMVLPLSMTPIPVLPNAQTGLIIHGRLFPHTGTYFDYAITAANNRSDVEASLDFNDNKALGLRLQLSYETPQLGLSLGGYGYLGQINIRNKEERIDVSANTIHIVNSSTDKHTEVTGAVDVVVTLFKAKLQAEYARSLLKYDVHPLRIAPYYNLPMGGYVPNHTRWAGYVLLAYEFSLQRLLDDTTLTPWAMFERSMLEDSNPTSNANDFRAGLNFMPNSYWVVKVEGAMMWAPESENIKSNIYFVGAQAAVTF